MSFFRSSHYVSFVLDILKEQAPKDATKEQLQAFLNAQEDKIIEKMAAENKIDAEVEMLGAASAEYACLVANPTLVVEGDADWTPWRSSTHSMIRNTPLCVTLGYKTISPYKSGLWPLVPTGKDLM